MLTAQEKGASDGTIYTDSLGQVYVRTNQPIYFFVKPTEGAGELVAVPTDKGNSSPIVFDREGSHYIVHRSSETGKNVRFRIVADGSAPKSAVSFLSGLLFVYNNTYFVEMGATAAINTTDNLSGVSQTYVSMNRSSFEPHPGNAIEFYATGESTLKFYATDRVGNSATPSTIKVFVAQDATVEMENIYFDLNSAKLRSDSYAELNRLVDLLRKYPKVKIELRAHTDSRGNPSYNLKLSEDRALNTMEYLVARGIPKSRIKAKGYGDTQPVNDCRKGKNCTEEMHRQNRRVEIIISKIQPERNN